MPACPICTTDQTVKNGHIHIIEQPTKKVIDAATRELIDRLLLERISLAGIARSAQVSEPWLQLLIQNFGRLMRSISAQTTSSCRKRER
jgi:hypothetical protein